VFKINFAQKIRMCWPVWFDDIYSRNDGYQRCIIY